MAAASSTVWMNWLSGGGQRLDAVDDAGLLGCRGDRGEAFGTPFAALRLPAGLERALGRRAVHEDARAEVGGEIAQPVHHVDGAGALRGVAGGDRQALGRQHQVVQAGDGDAGIGGGPAQLGAARGRQGVRLLRERERRDLQAVVAHRAGERALALEGQLPDHLVAERDAHGSPPSLALIRADG